MNYQEKSKEELIVELHELQKKYDSLKALYDIDILERKKAEEKILKLNRVYAFISQINQTIVRTRDKDKLFEEACRIAIEHGKFQMAWIGFVDEETKLVNTATFAGVEDGYLSKINKISVSDLPEGRGPTGKAIREGKHFVCDDIANDPRMTPWKDEALMRGYRSSIALPIIFFGKVIGAFTLYASISQFFDQDEIILLDEVTNDISFALESIETEKKRQETEDLLHESEETYRMLYDSLSDALFISELNEDGSLSNFILVNDIACQRLGYTREELLSKNPFDINSENAKHSLAAKIQKILNEKHVIVETEHATKDGRIIPVELSTNITRFRNKTIFHSVARDITERKRTETELIAAKEKAEESDLLKTAFLQNMSHEIRTPMNAIMGFSDLMKTEYNNRTKLQKFSEIISQRCNDLLDIINDILDIAKIESGQLSVNTEECNLNELFAELSSFFNEYQNRIYKQQIKFSLQSLCNPSENVIVTDKVKLKQIFINLISNAFKFTDEGKIEGGCKFDENHNLLFYVSDTGIGIPSDKQEEVFKRFSQLNQASRMNIGGTGLGLSIVKGLVSLLGGKIFLESEPGKGSTFSFAIPYKTIQPLHRAPSAIEKPKDNSFSNKTILIVEDDLFNAEYLKEILFDTGLNILQTENGKKAVEISITHPIDLVLMDIRLPDIDGYEATRQIRQHKPALKIIAQTAYASHDEKEKAIAAGCNDYISKPTKKDSLLSMVNKYLPNGNENENRSPFTLL